MALLMVCSGSSSDAGITLRWAGSTLFTPFRTQLVRVEGGVKGEYLEILARHVYHIMIEGWSTGLGTSEGVLGVFIR
jgi:hypothetical protein